MSAPPLSVGNALAELFRFKWFWGALLCGTAAVAALLVLSGPPADARHADAVPVLGGLPAFSHLDQTGAEVTDADLRGRVTIASFIFTRCPTVCPVVTAKVKKIGERLGGSGVLLVSFSVDPDYDTPAVLASFAAQFDASPERWKFITGDAAKIRASVERSLKIAMDRQGTLPGGIPDIFHGTHLVLLDGGLRIRGYYDYTDPGRLDALVRDARALSRAPAAGAHNPPPSTLPAP